MPLRARWRSRFRESEPAYRQWTFLEPSLNCVAVKVFHYQEIHTVLCADIVEVANMRMVERGDGPGFAFEALTRARLEDLDGDGAVRRVSRPL